MTHYRELSVTKGGVGGVVAVRHDDRRGRAELDALAFAAAGPGVVVRVGEPVDRVANDKGKGRYR